MAKQLSQDYNVDSRYRGMKNAQDNRRGLDFVRSYVNRRASDQRAVSASDTSFENKFIVSGPGDETYSFRNAFRASK